MTNKLTLSQLGEQYLLEAQLVDEKIKFYRNKLNNDFKNLKSEEVIRIRQLIRLYYNQRYELRYTGKYLLQYYDKNERRIYE